MINWALWSIEPYDLLSLMIYWALWSIEPYDLLSLMIYWALWSSVLFRTQIPKSFTARLNMFYPKFIKDRLDR